MEDVTDSGFDNGSRFRNADEIPVFIVDATTLGQVETAFVPEGARAIFVSGRNLERQFDAFYLRGEKAWQQYSPFEKSLVTGAVALVRGSGNRREVPPCKEAGGHLPTVVSTSQANLYRLLDFSPSKAKDRHGQATS